MNEKILFLNLTVQNNFTFGNARNNSVMQQHDGCQLFQSGLYLSFGFAFFSSLPGVHYLPVSNTTRKRKRYARYCGKELKKGLGLGCLRNRLCCVSMRAGKTFC